MAPQTKTTTPSTVLPDPFGPPWLIVLSVLWLLGMLWSAIWPKSRFYGLPTLYLNAYSLRLVKWWQRPRGARAGKTMRYVSRRRPIDIEEGIELKELPHYRRYVRNRDWEHGRAGSNAGEDVLGLGRQRRLQVEAEAEQRRLADEEQQRWEMEEAVVAGREEGREVEKERDKALRALDGRGDERMSCEE